MEFLGNTITSHYDQLGRLTQTDLPDGSSLTYTYTSSGQIAGVTDSRGTTSYSYDGEGRLLSQTDPDGVTISYSYDALGRKETVTSPFSKGG